METTFSVLKWEYGNNVRSRKYRNQVKEIKVHVVVSNMGRIMKKKFILIEELVIIWLSERSECTAIPVYQPTQIFVNIYLTLIDWG